MKPWSAGAMLGCFGPPMMLNQDSQRLASYSDRWTTLGPGLPSLPERLLLAHAQGRVLFIAGAGVSQPAGYPSFRKLTGAGKHGIADRIRRGDRSDTLLAEIVELVRPWVEVEARGQWGEIESNGRVRKLRDLVALRMKSGDLVRPSGLALEGVSDIDFLCDLAEKLDAVVCARGFTSGGAWAGTTNVAFGCSVTCGAPTLLSQPR
jgi:hypothetical protein